MPLETEWFVYIVQCRDGSFYTGITTNLEKRVQDHNTGSAGAKYTRSRRPVRLVYHEAAVSRSAAARREFQVKQMTPAGKLQLMRTALDGPAAEEIP